MRVRKSPFDCWADAGADQGAEDAREISSAVVKYGADRAHNAQSERMAARKSKMKAAGLSDAQIAVWSDAHAAAFTASQIWAKSVNVCVIVSFADAPCASSRSPSTSSMTME